MQYLPYVAGLLVVVAFVVLAFGRTRHKAEALTTEALLAAAQTALDDAQRLADARARSIESEQAALAADMARIAKARARMAGNAAAPAQS
jgi:hypothetical protein